MTPRILAAIRSDMLEAAVIRLAKSSSAVCGSMRSRGGGVYWVPAAHAYDLEQTLRDLDPILRALSGHRDEEAARRDRPVTLESRIQALEFWGGEES